MTFQVSGGPPATRVDRRTARARVRLLGEELTRVRAAAQGWRNGIGALLAGLIGFGLIKGRTDIGELASPYDAVVGSLLAAALVAGGVAAWQLMRATHGRPAAVPAADVIDPSASDPVMKGLHDEALASWTALQRGVFLAYACALMLCTAVAITWYGPAKGDPQVEISLSNGTVRCGKADTIGSGRLTLKTSAGSIPLDLQQIVGLRAVDSCTPKKS